MWMAHCGLTGGTTTLNPTLKERKPGPLHLQPMEWCTCIYCLKCHMVDGELLSPHFTGTPLQQTATMQSSSRMHRRWKSGLGSESIG
jgi:hypothetical protein